MSLSIAIITLNEEHIIAKTIQSIKDLADEIVIMDSGSTDRTVKICEDLGCRVYRNPMPERCFFGRQKNLAINHCTGKWILSLDADEIPDSELIQDIRNKVNSTNCAYDAYYLYRFNIYYDYLSPWEWLRSEKKLRLFKRNTCEYNDKVIHETIVPTKEIRIGKLNGRLLHHTTNSVHRHLEKLNHYSTMISQFPKRGFILVDLALHPMFMFFKEYILNFRILDGIIGIFLSLTVWYYWILLGFKIYMRNKKVKNLVQE